METIEVSELKLTKSSPSKITFNLGMFKLNLESEEKLSLLKSKVLLKKSFCDSKLGLGFVKSEVEDIAMFKFLELNSGGVASTLMKKALGDKGERSMPSSQSGSMFSTAIEVNASKKIDWALLEEEFEKSSEFLSILRSIFKASVCVESRSSSKLNDWFWKELIVKNLVDSFDLITSSKLNSSCSILDSFFKNSVVLHVFWNKMISLSQDEVEVDPKKLVFCDDGNEDDGNDDDGNGDDIDDGKLNDDSFSNGDNKIFEFIPN